MSNIEIFNQNSLYYVKNLIDNNITEIYDCIITDPPYNISKNNNFDTMGRAGIDFGEWDKEFDLISWISNVTKLLKKGGNIIIFNDWKNLGLIANELEINGCIIKDPIRWIKDNPMPRNRDRRFITDYEMAIWAIKPGNSWTFNRISNTYERPEIKGPLTSRTEKLIGNHPTQKPIYVMRWLIERLSNEGDIILDPFMGSGSTGLACIETNRKFVGIELDTFYFNLANQRILAKLQNKKEKNEASPLGTNNKIS